MTKSWFNGWPSLAQRGYPNTAKGVRSSAAAWLSSSLQVETAWSEERFYWTTLYYFTQNTIWNETLFIAATAQLPLSYFLYFAFQSFLVLSLFWHEAEHAGIVFLISVYYACSFILFCCACHRTHARPKPKMKRIDRKFCCSPSIIVSNDYFPWNYWTNQFLVSSNDSQTSIHSYVFGKNYFLWSHFRSIFCSSSSFRGTGESWSAVTERATKNQK